MVPRLAACMIAVMNLYGLLGVLGSGQGSVRLFVCSLHLQESQGAPRKSIADHGGFDAGMLWPGMYQMKDYLIIRWRI